MSDAETARRAARWSSASLGRVVPDGTLEQPTVAIPSDYAGDQDLARVAGGPAVITPVPRPRAVPRREPTSGLRLSLVGRVIVGVALVVTLGFLVWQSWLNLVG